MWTVEKLLGDMSYHIPVKIKIGKEIKTGIVYPKDEKFCIVYVREYQAEYEYSLLTIVYHLNGQGKHNYLQV